MVVSRKYEGREKAGKERAESPCPTKESRTRLSIDNALPGANMKDTNRRSHVYGALTCVKHTHSNLKKKRSSSS
jgi:hypothetical protein